MKYSILKADATAYKDSLAMHDLDVSGVPSNVRALQFNDAYGKGHIEFELDSNGDLLPNEEITALPDWSVSIFTAWDNAKIAHDAQLARQAEELAIAEAEFLAKQTPQTP